MGRADRARPGLVDRNLFAAPFEERRRSPDPTAGSLPPRRRHGRRRQSLEWPDLALGRVRSDLAYAARNPVRQEGHPRGDDHPGLGRHLCRAGALPRPLGEAVRHRRQSREHPRPNPAWRQSFRSATSRRISAAYSNVTSGRPITKRLVPPGTPMWGSKWKQANADWFAHSFNIYVHGSWYPHRENYLDLDPTYKDAYGQPLVRMTFDIRDNELRMSEYLTKKAAEIAQATGATIVGTPSPRKGPYDSRAYQTTHVTGGSIMGADPRTSVVSSHLQHWDAQTLFVVGASVYPFNAGYNPTGPLGALALRLGDDLVRYTERPRML